MLERCNEKTTFAKNFIMASLKDISLTNKVVLIRVDFNVPLNENKQVTDDTRIRAAMPTIKNVLENGATVVLMSHLGRPKGKVNSDFSLKPVADHLAKSLGQEVHFLSDCISAENAGAIKALPSGSVVLLENLRFYAEEEAGDAEFAKKLAALGDIYVNDAFGTAHRAHASTAVMAQYFDANQRAFGFLMGDEVRSLEKALKTGKKPIVAVIGGAKVSSKIDVLSHLMNLVDAIVVGGGMAYTFAKAEGDEVGKSLVEDDKLAVAQDLILQAKQKGVELLLPVDSINATEFADQAPASTTSISEIPENQLGLDIGPKSMELFSEALKQAKTIIWNGPMGVFEFEHYSNGTKAVGEAMVEATQNGAFSLVGGGDSVAAAVKFGLAEKLSYVSTGGGAMLEYLEGKELPGIAAMYAK